MKTKCIFWVFKLCPMTVSFQSKMIPGNKLNESKMTSSRTTIEYSPLHSSRYKPAYFLLEENVADEFFNSFARLDWKKDFKTMSSDEQNQLRIKVVNIMLAGDPENELLRRDDCSSVLEIPCITRRRRKGRLVECLRYCFEAKQLFYGQTVEEDNAANRIDTLEQKVAKLETWSEKTSTMLEKTVVPLIPITRSLAKRIDDAEKILSEVSYAQAMSAAYVMNQNYRKNKRREARR